MIWALVAGALAFWGLRLFVSAPSTPSYAVGVGEATAPRGDLSRLLGPDAVAAPMAQPEAASRFTLSGVLAPKEGYAVSHGVALIAVDGRPARAYQVGARLVDNWYLQGVTRRSASLGPSQATAAAVVLEMPERAGPATGVLPGYNGGEMVGTNLRQLPPMPQPGYSEGATQPASPPPQDATQPVDQGGGSPGPQMGQGPPRRAQSR